MAADLHIHVMDNVFEDDLAVFFSHTLGSKWFDLSVKKDYDSPEYNRVIDSPNVWVGEVSWLKAGIFDDEENYVPTPVMSITEIIGEELPVIDDDLISKIENALHETNTTSYSVTQGEEVVEFLNKHKGKRAFTVSW